MMRNGTRFGSALLFGAVCALGACGKTDTAADSAAAPAMATDSAGAMANAAAPAAGGMSAANIMSLIGLTNAGEIGAGKIAEEKGTNADVRAFAKMMVADHEAMQKAGDSLGTAKNVMPEPPAQAEQKKQMNDAMMATLNSTAKGAAFDKAYMDGQIAGHTQALNDLQGFSASAPDPDLKAMIDGAIPKVQQHLDRAKELAGKLGGGAH